MTATADLALLAIDDLHVAIEDKHSSLDILRGVSLSLRRGEMQGLVGETGSGKTMTARAIMGQLPPRGRITRGSILFAGRELVGAREKDLHAIRGTQIGMVFQNPRTALYPMATVERQMGNVLTAHLSLPKAARRQRVRELLGLAGIPDVDRVARAYPHELSGGMAQRVVIATALSCSPEMLIADEPTTGLDATIQRQILELLAELRDRLNLSVLMITHDLGIVAQYCDSVTVMNGGEVVERGDKRQVLLAPRADYTSRLIAASRLTDVRSTGVDA